MARHVLKGEAAVRSATLVATALPRGARAMECSAGSVETSMIGWTPPGRKQVRQSGGDVPKEETRRWQRFHDRLEDILEMLEESGGPEAARPVSVAVGQWFHSDEDVESHLALCRKFLS